MDCPTQDSTESIFRQNFDLKVKEYEESHQGSRRKPWTRERIFEVINHIKEAQSENKGKRTPMHYYWMHKYEIMTENIEEYLIFKRKTQQQPTIRIVPREEYFDMLSAVHKACGHGGRDKMLINFNKQYYIPRKAVELFSSLCPVCEARRNNLKKPIVAQDFNIRGQVDIFDFNCFADGEYKWLLHYQDCAKKFVSLRPLKTNKTNEVALELMKIFMTFGAPYILHSNNGCHFIAQVIKELAVLWPVCKVIYGNPRPPQNQGIIEQNSQDASKMLQVWMNENKSTNWSIGCYFVQYKINASLDNGIGKSPYKAVFGSEPEAGLSSSSIPSSVLKNIETEEQLNCLSEQQSSESDNMWSPNSKLKFSDKIPSAINNEKQSSDNDLSQNINTQHIPSKKSNDQQLSDKMSSSQSTKELKFCGNIPNKNKQKLSDKITSQNSNKQVKSDNDKSEQQVKSDNDPSKTMIDIKIEFDEWSGNDCDNISERTDNICEKPHAVYLKETVCKSEEDSPFQIIEEHKGIKREPETKEDINYMVKKVPPFTVGDTVFVSVPKADRGPLNIKIIKAKIVDLQNGVYRVANKTGIIKNWFSRKDLEVSLDTYEDVISYTPISLSEAVKNQPVIVCQQKCICKPALNQCRNNRCACYKNKILCGPKCHSSVICVNK